MLNCQRLIGALLVQPSGAQSGGGMSGEVQTGHKATVRAVADRAGVAISSVSRVLNEHPDVSEAMRTRVLAAAEELGYQPNLLAQSLRSGSTKTVGFVVRDIANPLFADIVKGAETTLREAGYSMLLTNSEDDPDLDAQYIELFLRRRVDGLILSLQSEEHPATLAALQGADCPLVLVDRDVPVLGASAVLCDHFSGVRHAVDHMISLGHRRIGIVAGPTTIRASRDRLRGYEDAHRSAGLPIDPGLVRMGSYAEDFGQHEATRLLELDDPPTALLCGGIQLTNGTLNALRVLGLRIGHDVSFVSCDDMGWMQLLDPPISTVSRQTVQMGRLAAGLLVDLLTGGRARVEPLGTNYVERGSVRPPRRD
jgi:LacI family transcriptional regulator